jgi:GNAT superfamily N-acetyltransferase
MNDILIRKATLADLERIVEHNLAMALQTEDRRLDPVRVRRGTRGVLDDASHGFYLVAEHAGQPAGQLMITYEWSDWRNGRFWWIQSVYVRPEFRRRGIFRALFDHLAGMARESGACGLRLYADRDNQSAHAVYRRLGMRESHYDMFEMGDPPGINRP